MENVLFTVRGKLSWGHRLEISAAAGNYLGTVQQEPLTLMPRFSLYMGEEFIGQIKKEFTFFGHSYTLDCNDWQVEGDFFGWDYTVTDGQGGLIMQAASLTSIIRTRSSWANFCQRRRKQLGNTASITCIFFFALTGICSRWTAQHPRG